MTFQELASFVVRYVGWAVPLPLIIGIYRKKYLMNELRVILYFSCNSVFFELISRIMSRYKIPNLNLFHLYVLIEFFFISWFYYEIFKRYISPKIIPSIFIIFTVFSLIDSFVWHNILTFNSYAKTLECLIIVSYTVFYLYKTFDEFQDQDPSETPVFWINAGFLFYFSGCLFLFTFSNFILTQGRPMGMITWALHAFFIVIMYSLISVGLWKSTT
ncbi:MAG: hypothetical protein MUF58_23745 [Arcicella sp.]|jgi:hypothetical protein|nr:hypothetical protein [Arcicella sp.]